MWTEAIRVAIVGFSVVFLGLIMLAVGVKVMSFLCGIGKGHAKKAQAK